MASDEEIKTLAVKIALDASSFTQQAQEFKKQVSSLDSGFKASVAGIKDWGTQSTHLKDQVKALGQQIDVQKQVVSSYQTQIAKTSTALETHAKQLVTNRDSITKLKAEYDQSTTTLGKNAEATKNLKKQLDDAEQALSKSKNQVRRNQSAIDGYNIQLNNATGKLNTMEAALKNANSALFDHTNALAKAGASLQSAGGKIKNVGGKLSGIGQNLTIGVTAPIAAAGTALFKLSENFEEAKNTIRRGTGETGASLEALDGTFKQVYSDLPTSMGNASEAVADLKKRTDLTGNALKDLAEQEISLAKVSNTDLSTTIQDTTRMFKDAKIAPKDYASSLDYVYTVTEHTGVGLDTLSEEMVKYGAPLREMGFNWQQSAAMLGQFEQAGVNTELVMGSMRIALGNFAKAGKDPVTALEQIIGKIKDAGSTSESNALALQVFGKRAGPDMAAAIREGHMNLQGLLDTLKNSPDSISVAEKSTETLTDKWTKLKNSLAIKLEPVGKGIADDLEKATPAIESVADDIGKLTDKFADSSESTREFTLKFALIAAITGPTILGIGKVTQAVGNSVSVLGKGISGVANFVKGVKGITPAAGEAIPVMQKLGLAIAANPYAALAIAIGAVAAAIGVMVVKTLNAKKPVDDYIQSLKNEDKAWQDLKKAANDKAATDLAELSNTKAMIDQLDGLVDANGKVIGSKETAKKLVDIINSTTGKNELQMINDQIVGWNNARDSINKYIEAKKAQALIDANQGAYTSALKNIKDADASIGQQQLDIQKQKKTVKDLEDTLEKELDNGNTYDFILAARVENEKKRLDSMQTQYGEHAKTISGYRETITNMNDAIAANAEGDYSKVESALNRATITYTAATGATKQQLLDQVQAAKKSLDQVLFDRQTGDKNITDVEINAAKDRYNKAATEYDKEVGQAGAAAAAIGQSYAGGLNSTAGAASAAGANLGNSAASGADSVSTYGIGQKKADEFGVGMASHNSAAYSAGYSAGERAKQGMADSLSGVNELFNEKLSYYYGNARAARLEGRAIGDTNWRGGLLRINEEGGEIVNLPQHAQIIPHDISMEIAKAVGGAVKNGGKNQFNVAVNIYGSATASDGKAIATVVSNVIARQVNARR